MPTQTARAPQARQPACPAAGQQDPIALVRSQAEARFLAVGRSLEESSTILDRLAATFSGLQGELESAALEQAARDLSGAAGALAGLSDAYRTEREALGRLAAAGTGMDGRIGRMHKAVKAVGTLGISVQIEAMHLGQAGADFTSFAQEINRSLKLAQSNLADLGREAGSVRGHLDKADAAEREFDARNGEALRLVPERLKAIVEAMNLRRRQASAAADAVAARSQQVGRRVGEAVMALQIGDITRQRVEHVQAALALLDHASGRSPLAGLGLRLQSAQLIDAADDLEREVARIAPSLRDLPDNARAITALGAQAYGGAGGGGSTFLADLKQEVAGAQVLLEGLGKARDNADRVVEAVRVATTTLAGHLQSIHSLDSEIRIMGLNTTLKCGRLGMAGRPLAVVAQELRVCANDAGTEAQAVMASVERMTAEVASLADEAQARRTEIGAVAAALTGSVDRFGAAGRGIADALSSLGPGSEAVGQLLAESADQINLLTDIGAKLRAAAAELAVRAEAIEAAAGGQLQAHEMSSEDAALLARIAASYTMAQERQTHARVTGSGLPSPAPVPLPADRGTAEAAVDDFLF